jgi:oxysterol-binding protein 1
MSLIFVADDAGAACRGAINMRIARLSMDPQDKLRFEIQGKSSVKYHLRANHQVEAKRWYWALNNAIQWTKDEDREEQKRLDRQSEVLKNAKAEQDKRQASDSQSLQSNRTRSGTRGQTLAPPPQLQTQASSAGEDDENGLSMYESSVVPATRLTSRTDVDGFDRDEDMGDDASSHEPQPAQKDALNITAQSLKMQLDLLSQVSISLREEVKRNPTLQFSDPIAVQAMSTYESSVGNLRGLIGSYLRLASDRDAYWQYRLEREANMRRLWEDSMTKVAKEQEDLQNRMGEVEDKRKRTKRALRDALENLAETDPASPYLVGQPPQLVIPKPDENEAAAPVLSPMRKKSTVVELAEELSDTDSDQDEEFFDAVDAGEVEVVNLSEAIETKSKLPAAVEGSREKKMVEIQKAFIGYEDPIRKRLKLDADNRPKISLWVSSKTRIILTLLTSVGYFKIHDWQGYDQNDSTCLI